MELINQHTKRIMEECKARARDAGLTFDDSTLEYVVTNRDLLELTPKVMIPTLYDYWVHDVEVLREKGRYELYPNNPYETVINTRPAVSFYNDNNPDWLNVMIFYHVLAHIDFFQNNVFFKNTWESDFLDSALTDKRLIANLRAEKGRWVDYVIEFSRGIDNLVGYYTELRREPPDKDGPSARVHFYFDVFLQDIKGVNVTDYLKDIKRYNQCVTDFGNLAEASFFAEVAQNYSEFEALFQKHFTQPDQPQKQDLLQFIMHNSAFIKKDENLWMRDLMQVVRKTSLFFQPQIRTKIMNEGWASYWHEKLFLSDDRIKGQEIPFARVNSGVTTMPRVGLNPYALGMQIFYYIEEMADKGRNSFDFRRLTDSYNRKHFDRKMGLGLKTLFETRENYSDFTFINAFVDQDFVDRNNLFVAGERLNQSKMVWEYYVKSRNAEDYRQMLMNNLYHPPHIDIDIEKTDSSNLYLKHRFEGKPLVRDFLPNTMLGLEMLWGAPVSLETNEVENSGKGSSGGDSASSITWKRVLYTMKDKKLFKKNL